MPHGTAEKRSAYQREYYRKNKGRRIANARASHLRRNYGLTQEQYADMLRTQSGGCAICHTTETGRKSGPFLIDHCHETGTVRGLLCHGCNVGLGGFRDNPAHLEAAISYLKLTKGN